MAKKLAPHRFFLSGANEIFFVRMTLVNHSTGHNEEKKVYLFSDSSHTREVCPKELRSMKLNDFLVGLSKTKEASLYLESVVGRNIWANDNMSHQEDVFLSFQTEQRHHFNVNHIDERFYVSSIEEMVTYLLNKLDHQGVQQLFDIITERNIDRYKQLIDPQLQYIISKYKFDATKNKHVVDAVLQTNLEDLISFYTTHRTKLVEEQKAAEKIKSIESDTVLYEFMASFFMFMVDLTFFIRLSTNHTTLHIAYLGSQHIHNIISACRKLGIESFQLASSADLYCVDATLFLSEIGVAV